MKSLVTVVVVEEGRGERLLHGLWGILGPLAPTAVLGSRAVKVPDEAPALLLCGGGEDVRAEGPRTIAVLASDLTRRPTLALPPDARVLFSPQNRPSADFVSGSGLGLLDCGLSLRDTLTLSSHTELEAVISLQREVADLWDNPLDPVDIPLTMAREVPAHLLLYAAGICLLAGWSEQLQQIKI